MGMPLPEINGYAIDPVVDGLGRLRPAEAFPNVRADRWRRHRPLLDTVDSCPSRLAAF